MPIISTVLSKEFIIYCDESISKGQYYSDFYGGALVCSSDIDNINNILKRKKEELMFKHEIKWVKVTANYLQKYIEIIDIFFNFIESDKIKVRIMFRQSAVEAVNLTTSQEEQGFQLLYYQFIKHAFGLKYSNPSKEDIYIRTYFDELPDTKEKNELFKNHVFALQSLTNFKQSKIRIRRDDIAEINSKDHPILQCLDIILGCMAFRLNDFHKEKVKETGKRGNRTIAKEKLYKHILLRIKKIYPNFNIGISTGQQGSETNIWDHPYRHWSFKPSEFKIDNSKFK